MCGDVSVWCLGVRVAATPSTLLSVRRGTSGFSLWNLGGPAMALTAACGGSDTE